MPFNSTSKEEWLLKTEADLKGKALSSLDWQLSNNIAQPALIHQEDVDHEQLSPITEGKKNNSWKIGESIHVNSNASLANELAIQALAGGATALAFHYDDELDLSLLLKGINLEWINTYFYGATNNIDTFIEIVGTEKNQNLELVNCAFFNTYYSILPLAKFYQIDSKVSENIAEDIASIALSYTRIVSGLENTAIEYLNRLMISIALTDQFLVNIAKIRACKLILLQIIDALDIKVRLPQISASLSTSSISEDADYNKIKMMPHALSGLIGGVDEIYLPPSAGDEDKALFKRRISRNINHLLELESFMDRVVDPAAGSYYLESLTDKIAAEAWSLFQNNQIQA